MSFVWVLYMGGCLYPRGAVGSRPMPTRLCCSELHWCIPVVLPVGQPGAPASSIRLPTWFVSWWMDCGDSAACLFCGWVALRTWFHYNLLLCILQCTAGLSGTMTSWNVLNSSVVCIFREPTPKRATLPKTTLVRWNLRIQPYYLSAPVCCPSSPFGFILPAQRQCFLHVSQLCEYCLGASLAETNQSAGCISPYEIRGMRHAGYLRWYFGSFSLACDASRMPSLAAPPLGGTWLFSPSRLRGYDWQIWWRLCPWRPSDKLIWEDAERGISCSPASCTAWHMPE